MYTKDEIKGIFMCLGKPFTAIYGGEGKTIIRTQVLLRGRTEFLTPLSETLNQYEIESNVQNQNSGTVLAITKRDSEKQAKEQEKIRLEEIKKQELEAAPKAPEQTT